MLTEIDLKQLQKKGISKETIKLQLHNFETGFPYANITAACTPEHGIQVVTDADKYVELYEKALSEGINTLKFVPASGAASRMFKTLFEFLEAWQNTPEFIAKTENEQGKETVIKFIGSLEKFAFFTDLENAAKKHGENLIELRKAKKYNRIVELFLTEKGLNYGNLPKGLLKFHAYDGISRTSFEEHFVEGIGYASANSVVNLHFTVSPEHLELFEALSKQLLASEAYANYKINVGFSIQKPATDTVAADENNRAFRNADGSILFRPGGHGALIENLNDCDSELIFIKNIDNVVPDRLKPETVQYKKVLAGVLLEIRNLAFALISKLENQESEFAETIDFIQHKLNLHLNESFFTLNETAKRNALLQLLNRPIRVCGMVKNEGEPGGGPFFVKDKAGKISPQIVESSQIDMQKPENKQIIRNATHFNPVDLVCYVRNRHGAKFDLRKFVDAETGFISIKSKDGKTLKAQELPGLWNGAMGFWNTVFVEVPIETFNPVKTVFDLLRPQHL